MQPTRFRLAVLLCLSAILPANAAHAVVIAGQNFNSLSAATTETFDSLPSGSMLTNASSRNTNPALGLTFRTIWMDTRSTTLGPVTPTADTSDFIGVNSFGGSNAPNVGPTGVPVAAGIEQNFEFNDGDGLLRLIFDPIDTFGFTDLSLSLNYWINSTGYEADDRFAVRLSDGSTTATLLNFGEPELEANTSADDGTANWRSLSANLSTLGLSRFLTLTIDVDNNAADENIFIDNVLLQGTPGAVVVPEPSTFAMGGTALALLGLAYARRRRQVATA